MSSGNQEYNRLYVKPNYFGYRPWIYRSFVRAVLGRAGVRRGASILDVGCGQGFFSYLLSECGMHVVGMDISLVGAQAARKAYGHLGIDFVVGDVWAFPLRRKFDCVFARSLSVYNSEAFSVDTKATKLLLERVRPGGSLIFIYNANLGGAPADGSWRHHSPSEVRKHFGTFPSHGPYFLSKVDSIFLGRLALSRPVTALNLWLSRTFSLGGEYVAIIGKY